MKASYVINTVVVLCLVIVLFLCGFYCGNRIAKLTIPSVIESVRIDTVTISDTVIKPIPHYVRLISTDTIITPKDTVYIPIEQKTVIKQIDNDTVKGTIKAVYSGYNASLDTLQYDLSLTNKTLLKRRKFGFTVGVTSGIGYDFNNKVMPFIGVGISYGYNF